MRLSVILSVSFAVGFAFSLVFLPSKADTDEERLAGTKTGASIHASDTAPSAETPALRIERFVELAQRTDSVDRNHEIYLAVQAFSGEDFRELLGGPSSLKAFAETLGKLDYAARKYIMPVLIARWLAVDQNAAVAWLPVALDTLDSGEELRASIAEVFAKRQPVATLALVASLENRGDRAFIIARALRELTMQDAAKAKAWLAQCTDPEDRRAAERAIRRGEVEVDPLRAVDLAASLGNGEEGSDLVMSAVRRASKIGRGVMRQLVTTPMPPWMLAKVMGWFANDDPELAVDLAVKASGPGTRLDNAMEPAFSALTKRDPALAISKLEGLEGTDLASAVSAIGLAWAEREPAAALSWLTGRIPSGAKPGRSDGANGAVLDVFHGWVESNKDAARTWADALQAGEIRDTVQTRLALILAKNGNPGEAVQVLAKLGNAADAKTVSETSAAWAKSNPKAAAIWAVQQAPGPVQNSALEVWYVLGPTTTNGRSKSGWGSFRRAMRGTAPSRHSWEDRM